MIEPLSDFEIESLQNIWLLFSDRSMTQSLNRSILELPAVLLSPALDDNFLVGIELH